jgi:serine/threonine-protein kinase MRCK
VNLLLCSVVIVYDFSHQITTSLMEPPGLKNHTLMLADTESEKTKWVVALSELHRILKRNNLPNRTVSALKYIL